MWSRMLPEKRQNEDNQEASKGLIPPHESCGPSSLI